MSIEDAVLQERIRQHNRLKEILVVGKEAASYLYEEHSIGRYQEGEGVLHLLELQYFGSNHSFCTRMLAISELLKTLPHIHTLKISYQIFGLISKEEEIEKLKTALQSTGIQHFIICCPNPLDNLEQLKRLKTFGVWHFLKFGFTFQFPINFLTQNYQELSALLQFCQVRSLIFEKEPTPNFGTPPLLSLNPQTLTQISKLANMCKVQSLSFLGGQFQFVSDRTVSFTQKVKLTTDQFIRFLNDLSSIGVKHFGLESFTLDAFCCHQQHTHKLKILANTLRSFESLGLINTRIYAKDAHPITEILSTFTSNLLKGKLKTLQFDYILIFIRCTSQAEEHFKTVMTSLLSDKSLTALSLPNHRFEMQDFSIATYRMLGRLLKNSGIESLNLQNGRLNNAQATTLLENSRKNTVLSRINILPDTDCKENIEDKTLLEFQKITRRNVRASIAMAHHPKFNAGSSLKTLVDSNIYEPNLWQIIFSLADCEIPKNEKALLQSAQPSLLFGFNSHLNESEEQTEEESNEEYKENSEAQRIDDDAADVSEDQLLSIGGKKLFSH